MKPFLPHMSHSKYRSGKQGKAIEEGITSLITDRKNYFYVFFKGL